MSHRLRHDHVTRRLLRGMRDTRGALVIEWAVILPIFLVVMTVILQIAIIGASSLVVRYAAFSAGRAAMVGLPEHTKVNAEDAAAMALMPLAPSVPGSDTLGHSFGRTIARQGQPWNFTNISGRMALARHAMQLEITPDEILAGPETLQVTLRYPLRLHIPFACTVLGERRVVNGVLGYYIDLDAHAELRSHGSRVAVELGQLSRKKP